MKALQEHLSRWMLLYVPLATGLGLVVGLANSICTQANSARISGLTTLAAFFVIFPMMIIELDRTEIFTDLRIWPIIRAAAGTEDRSRVESRTRRALQAAQKYSLVANSVKSNIAVEPQIEVVP
jgi:hypothetical protein